VLPGGRRGWSLKEAAERINAFRGSAGLDPGGLASLTATHLCERENWPGHGLEPSGRKPTPHQLAVLAAVYGCEVLDLVDVADREHLPPADLLVLDGYRSDRPAARSPMPPGIPGLTLPTSSGRNALLPSGSLSLTVEGRSLLPVVPGSSGRCS
jgi:hypothetical protein